PSWARPSRNAPVAARAAKPARCRNERRSSIEDAIETSSLVGAPSACPLLRLPLAAHFMPGVRVCPEQPSRRPDRTLPPFRRSPWYVAARFALSQDPPWRAGFISSRSFLPLLPSPRQAAPTPTRTSGSP